MSKIVGRVFSTPLPLAVNPEGIGDKAIEKMTVPELTAYAATHDIDINGLTKKVDILMAIQTVEGTGEQPKQ